MCLHTYRDELFRQVIGPIIRAKRYSKGWTLDRLDEEIGMDDKHIAKIERGEKSPSGLTLIPLQMVLHINSDEIIPDLKARMQDDT